MLSRIFRSQLPAVRSIPFQVSRVAFSTGSIAFKEAAAKQTKKKAATKKAPAAKPKKPTKKELKEQRVKQPIMPYFFYVKDLFVSHRDELMAKSFEERGKYLRTKWEGLTEDEKAPYVAKHEADKSRYLREKEEELKNKPPKRPANSFMMYANSIRNELVRENPNLPVSEIGKLAGEHWKNLPESEKKAFQDEASNALDAWKNAKAQWEASRST